MGKEKDREKEEALHKRRTFREKTVKKPFDKTITKER